MLAALSEAGWHNYSLFLDNNGQLFGYFETPHSLAHAQSFMAAQEVNIRWQELMDNQPTNAAVDNAYALAKERYAALNVDTEKALAALEKVAISLHRWQGDDQGGFEDPERGLSGGIMATGNYPGKARTVIELRQEFDKAYNLIPGNHRLNLHAIYLETETAVARNEIRPNHFANWLNWARANNHGVDIWGVDFGLLESQGNLIGKPVHYRNGRTTNMLSRAFNKVSRVDIFAQTGIQFMPINTLYQMLSRVESDSPQLQIVADRNELRHYQPQDTAVWDDVYGRYQKIVCG